MRFSTTISASLALLLRARLALGDSVSIPTEELRGLDPIDIGVDNDLEPRDDVVMTSRPPPLLRRRGARHQRDLLLRQG